MLVEQDKVTGKFISLILLLIEGLNEWIVNVILAASLLCHIKI